MHILGLLLGAVGVLLVVIWRLNQASIAARGVGEAFDEAHGAARRWFWRRKSTVDPLRQVDDPRTAAAAMMVAVAEYDGALTEAHQKVLRQEMARTFGASQKQADELIAYARWLNKGRGDIGTLFMKLLPLIRRSCGSQERADLISMLRQVQAVSGDSEVPATQIANLEAQLRSS